MIVRMTENTSDRKEYKIDLGHLIITCWWLKLEHRQGGNLRRKSNGELLDRFSFNSLQEMYNYIDSYAE